MIRWNFLVVLSVSCSALAASPALAQPAFSEDGWTVLETTEVTDARSARFHPTEGMVVGRRATTSSGGGVYRMLPFGRLEKLGAGDRLASVLVADDGDIFFSEDYGGELFRIEAGTEGSEAWAGDYFDSDADPVGMAIAPATHDGSVLSPGMALVVDRGHNGPDEVWAWDPAGAMTQTAVHTDDGTLDDALDVAITDSAAWVVDRGSSGEGFLYELAGDGTLTLLDTSEMLAAPVGVVADPGTGELWVADGGDDRIVRIDPATGTVTEVATDLGLEAGDWAPIDISDDGRQLLVTAGGAVHHLARCEVTAGAEGDCDASGTLDVCDLALEEASDCNGNGVPDACDIASDVSTDCDGDGVPDECPDCPPLEVVFVMDTSTSMGDEAAALCRDIQNLTAELQAAGIDVDASLLGISATPGGDFDCLTDDVINLYGTEVPGDPPTDNEVLGECPGGNEVASEDWGRATSVVAGLRPWGDGNVRLVVPIADEGPWCGDPVDDPGVDRDAVEHAIEVAGDADVLASPITGTGSSTAVEGLAAELAEGTGGVSYATGDAEQDLVDAILGVVTEACDTFSDCNDNGTPDACDVSSGASDDCDGDGVPDECQDPAPMCPPDAGVADGGPMDGGAWPDGSVSEDAAVGHDGSTSDAGGPPPGGDVVEEGGCGCHVPTHGRPGSVGFVALLSLLLVLGVRRSRRG
ncbi:MAG: MYXO-CTERM sorting domain-containing protein [Myxococcota bacterium]